MRSILAFLKRRWLLISIMGLVIMGLVFLIVPKERQIATAKVERGLVVSEVSVTGKVKTSQSLNLAFIQGGRINISVNVGDKVSRGDLLAHLDNADLRAQVGQADASVKVEQAKLDDLKNGPRPESVKSKLAELKKAQGDLRGYYDGSLNVLNDAYTKADDAVRKQTSNLFINDNTDNPQLNFSSSDYQAIIDSQFQRVLARNELQKWQSELNQLQISPTNDLYDSSLKNGLAHLAIIRTFLNRVSDVLGGATNLLATTIDSYKLNINTGRANINLASTNITNQAQYISSQKLVIDKTQSDYNLLIAGSTPEQIAGQKALVEQASANADYARAQYEKTILRAPFSGTVTKVFPVGGDIVPANSPVISLNGAGKYQIEASVAESDIAKVRIGNKASVTLDAYGPNVVFNADVVKLDLSATILEGVATYKATLQFREDDSRILPGLTANVNILSNRKENVLFAPTRDIIGKDSKKYLRVITDLRKGGTRDVEVETGLVGSDGRTEIISGASENTLISAE